VSIKFLQLPSTAEEADLNLKELLWSFLFIEKEFITQHFKSG